MSGDLNNETFICKARAHCRMAIKNTAIGKWLGEALGRLEAATRQNWTSTPPTEPGWYWCILPLPYSQKPFAKLVKSDELRGCGLPSAYYRALWLGPIPEPEPPAKEQL